MSRRQELFNRAADLGIKIIHAQGPKDAERCAIHLLTPDLQEVDEALDRAEIDLWPAIVVHSDLTWPNGGDK